ncbi:cytochrome P450 [Novosphingobium malaysiense]|uniref:Cytochrome P450 n=1 Tax=Novosphingobium malaysiense TaxID=1348853 RepID=A0A0B1ZIX7_9SPHN|nr:cytochrome P450 [Novosphingobium malaysiense]KHK89101.1 cytochrome P450 [Novosphingobium malaysiense]
MKSVPPVPKPDHVPEALVVDFDFIELPGAEDDIQAGYQAYQRGCPDIFWTPQNGGHWVATRAEDIVFMQRNTDVFSNRMVTLPPFPEGTPPSIPLEIDPPRHAQYRRPLMQFLTPGAVKHLEDGVRKVAIDQIEALLPQGGCEFIEDFAKVLPIHVFLDAVDLPREDASMLLPIAEKSVRARSIEDRIEAHREMSGYLLGWVRKRRAEPGDDLLSQIVTIDVDGEMISEDEALSYATLVLFGGLDTVAGMIGLIGKFLAEHPDKCKELVENLDDAKFLKNAIEELIRRHGIANTARVLTQDYDYKGVHFKKGDHILPPNLLAGVDDRVIDDPLTVDFNRKKPVHASFGNGAHACPGAGLARREIAVFLEEWLRRIPEFRVKPGTKPVLETGQVNGIIKLELVWP